VRLQLELATEPPAALADIGLVEQVLLNLAINARDAMPNGGELSLRTGQSAVEGGTSTNPDAYAGAFATLAVSDTGSGIPAEILSRIWEPFVTTKEAGKGTGLGLAIVQNIVQQHRGFIDVTSELGVGTTFQIYLPRAEPDAASSEPIAEEPLQPGTENILLVDDESPVRQLVRLVLERQGYRVLEARSGPDALVAFDESAARIDLLVTDLMMPGGMSGIELARELHRRDATLRVIYTSGYGPGYNAPDMTLTEGENFLAKPYVLSRLIGTVRRALDAPAREKPEQTTQKRI
jgi:CheY-like chemotaxis protein